RREGAQRGRAGGVERVWTAHRHGVRHVAPGRHAGPPRLGRDPGHQALASGSPTPTPATRPGGGSKGREDSAWAHWTAASPSSPARAAATPASTPFSSPTWAPRACGTAWADPSTVRVTTARPTSRQATTPTRL